MSDTAPLPSSVRAGDLVAGKYRVERVLGEGGMGIVVSALHEALGQRVAIKLLRPEAAGGREALGRFLREARAAAKLRSEHVARVIDTGTLDDGRPYMVMEHLEGKDLGAIIEDGPLPSLGEVVDWTLQACEAVAEAHAAGIVHRDLKPSNLFLTRGASGRPLVKVLDFGISKLDEGGTENLHLTRTTDVMGSPSYMSPEQLRASRDVDARSDIWSLGVILFELLSGQVPFQATTMTALVAVVLMEREPELHALRPDVPPAMTAIVARCLAKRPEDRYASVVELAQALEPYASQAQASHLDRIRGAALGSARSLPGGGAAGSNSSVGFRAAAPLPITGETPAFPPAAASSSRGLAGTATAWAETQTGPSLGAPPLVSSAPTRSAVFLIAAVLGAIALGGIALGGIALATRTRVAASAPSASALPSTVPMPLPSARKDLLPLPPETTPDVPPSAVAAGASATPPAPGATARKPASPGTAKTPVGPKPGVASDDPLGNIGRR